MGIVELIPMGSLRLKVYFLKKGKNMILHNAEPLLVYNINISIKVMKYVHKIPTKSMIILRIIYILFIFQGKWSTVTGNIWNRVRIILTIILESV